MGAVYFYHLTQSRIETTLAMLLGKARDVGWRVQVRGAEPDRMKWLDDKLWLGTGEDFLPHGLAGGDFDADQPVLLCTDNVTANGAACLMLVDGAEATTEEVRNFERVCVLFDGNDPQELKVARSQWKTLSQSGCAAQYWSQESGKWDMKSRSDP